MTKNIPFYFNENRRYTLMKIKYRVLGFNQHLLTVGKLKEFIWNIYDVIISFISLKYHFSLNLFSQETLIST